MTRSDTDPHCRSPQIDHVSVDWLGSSKVTIGEITLDLRELGEKSTCSLVRKKVQKLIQAELAMEPTARQTEVQRFQSKLRHLAHNYLRLLGTSRVYFNQKIAEEIADAFEIGVVDLFEIALSAKRDCTP